MKDQKINVAIVDDEVLVTKLLSDFISNQKDLSVCLVAYDGTDLINKLRVANPLPEIIILDMKMGEMDGVEVTGILKEKYPDIKILILSSYYKKSFLGYMMKAGVNAFLPKGIDTNMLLEALHTIHTKGFFFLEEQVDIMRNQIDKRVPRPRYSTEEELTKRELEILILICKQYTTSQIAKELFISERTVEGHRNNMFLKTGVKNLAGLVIYAVQKQLVDPSLIFYR